MPKRATRGSFKKNDPRCGRPKGKKNKFTTLKDAFIGAFQDVGGQEALAKFAKGKNKKNFYHMISNMLPKDVHVSDPNGQPLPSLVPIIIFQDKEESQDVSK
jgi:hypothetical protein